MLSSDAEVLAQTKHWIQSHQIVTLSVSGVSGILPFEEVPCRHKEVESGEYIAGFRFEPAEVVIQLGAEIIGRNEIEKSWHPRLRVA